MKKIVYFAFAALTLAGCTNLDEQLYSQISKKDFLSSPENLVLYTSRPYTMLQDWGAEQSYWTLVLQLGNEMAVPVAYSGSWSEIRYGELHSHDIPESNKLVRTGWEFCFNGISACNDALAELGALPDSPAVKKNIAEIKVLRAYYYFLAIDLWGNVPFSINKEEKDYPEMKDRAFMFSWIESEVKDNIQYLEEIPSVATYGLVTKDVAKFLLAKLYINAKVYIGTEKWAEAAQYCKEIIDSGHFSLTDTYAENFAIHNEGSSEAIFAIPYSSTFTSKGFYMYVLTLNADLEKIWNIGETWNGTHMGQPDFMATYDASDTRKKDTWLFGPVYDLNGKRWKYMDGVDADKNPIMKDYSLEDINIDESKFQNGIDRLDGARIIKWPYQSDGTLTKYTIDMENDFILMRYSDVVLMYVECLIRQNNAAQAALVPDFIKIRARAGLPPLADMSLDSFLVERQHEMALEGWVRNDLVRFGKYLNKWWAKEADPEYRLLLPIPKEMLGANPKLKQNPGY